MIVLAFISKVLLFLAAGVTIGWYFVFVPWQILATLDRIQRSARRIEAKLLEVDSEPKILGGRRL